MLRRVIAKPSAVRSAYCLGSFATQCRVMHARTAPASPNIFEASASSAPETAIGAVFSKAALTAHRDEISVQLQSAKKQLSELQARKDQVDHQALRYPEKWFWGIFGFLCVQSGVLFNWVYFTFDWNLVEPITFLLGYSVVWLGVSFYYATGREFTYDGLRQMLENRYRRRMYLQTQVDLEHYVALKERVALLEREAARYSQE